MLMKLSYIRLRSVVHASVAMSWRLFDVNYLSLWAQSQSHSTSQARNRTLCERLLDNGAFHYKVLFTLRCSISDLINILLGYRRAYWL